MCVRACVCAHCPMLWVPVLLFQWPLERWWPLIQQHTLTYTHTHTHTHTHFHTRKGFTYTSAHTHIRTHTHTRATPTHEFTHTVGTKCYTFASCSWSPLLQYGSLLVIHFPVTGRWLVCAEGRGTSATRCSKLKDIVKLIHAVDTDIHDARSCRTSLVQRMLHAGLSLLFETTQLSALWSAALSAGWNYLPVPFQCLRKLFKGYIWTTQQCCLLFR